MTSTLSALDALPPDRPFTRREVVAAGVTPRLLAALLDEGHLRRMLRGVFVRTALGDSIALRCAALRAVVPEDCVVCDRHAAWVLGTTMALLPGEHLELGPVSVFRPAGMGRLRNGLSDSGERNLVPADITQVDGLRVTTHLRTAHDLGRVRSPDLAISGMDAVVALGQVTREELVAGVRRYRGMRWVTTLRAIAPLVDGGSESPGESVTRLRWHQAHLPWPQTQVPVLRPSGRTAYLDLGLPDLQFGAEYDGEAWHTSAEQRAADTERRAEVTEAGWRLEVLVGSDVYGRQQTAGARLRAGVAAARRRQGDRVVL